MEIEYYCVVRIMDDKVIYLGLNDIKAATKLVPGTTFGKDVYPEIAREKAIQTSRSLRARGYPFLKGAQHG